MNFSPNERYRSVFKEGMSGWDVEAIQIALNNTDVHPKLVEDGAFGPITRSAAVATQKWLSITQDGIVGPETQAKLCTRMCRAAESHTVPRGLLVGICMGESSGIIPTTSALYPNGTRDYGPLQDNKSQTHSTEHEKMSAYDLAYECPKVANEIATQYRAFWGKPGVPNPESCWRLALLYYNWPAAAVAIVRGEGATWEYEEEKDGPKFLLTDTAPWILNVGRADIRTGWDWINFYINSKLAYVTSWTVT